MHRRSFVVAVLFAPIAGSAAAQEASPTPVPVGECPLPLAEFVAAAGTTDGAWIPMADAIVWFDFAQGRITQAARQDESPDGWKVFTITDDPSDDQWMFAFVP